MAVAAGIGAAGSIVGGVLGGKGAKKAAKAQLKAAQLQAQTAREGINLQRDIYNQNREDLAPWREAGRTTLADLTRQLPELTASPDPAQYREDPGYKFGLEEGMRAAMRGAAASGGIGSGGTLKSLMRYGQGYADQFGFDRARAVQGDKFNRLAAIAGVGQTATTQTGQMGQQFASAAQQGLGQVGNAQAQAGNARASGYVGQANAWTGALNNIGMIAANGGFGGGGSKLPAGMPGYGLPGGASLPMPGYPSTAPWTI